MRARRKGWDFAIRRSWIVALLSGVVVVPVEGQSPVGSWLAFAGCWTPADRDAEDASALCVVPGEDRVSAEFVTVRESEIVSRETARADGRPVDATQEGCEGTTTWRFSDDGHRVYHRSEHVCDGAVNRKGSGMMAMVSPTEWMDVSSVEVEGRVTPWVQRYRATTAEVPEYGDLTTEREMAVRAARMYSTTAPTIASIIEASRTLHAETVQAWLVESAPDMNVGAEQLTRMADAGVDSDVIDVVVAVSHPRRFRLQDEERTGAAVEQRERAGEDGRSSWPGRRYPRYHSPFGFGYHGYYGYGHSPSRYGYSPYGYGGYGRGYGGYYGIGYRPVVVSIEPRVESSSRGRLVRGQGYTRSGDGRPRGSATAGRDTGSSGSVSSAGGGSRGSTGRSARRRGGGSR